MSPDSDDEVSGSTGLDRIKEIFWPPSAPKDAAEDIIPAERRKAVMTSLDAQEVKFGAGAMLLGFLAGIVIPVIITTENKVTRRGKNTIAVAPDAWLLGGAIVLLCVIGLVVVWKRRRTLLAFDLFLVGFAFTLFIGLIGFLFILLGGWLLLRAWRINRYGTTSGKVIARQAAERRATKGGGGRGASPKGKAASKAPSSSGERKPPTASKRYTPKSAPKKKAPKPTT